jgi:hypothetical protein
VPPREQDRERLVAVLSAIRRRQRAADALAAIAIGAFASTVVSLTLSLTGASRPAVWIGSVASGLLTIILVARSLRGRWTFAASAHILERRHPRSLNVIVTAEELLRDPHRASTWITARVLRDAAVVVEQTRTSDVIPLWRTAAVCAASVALSVALAVVLPVRSGVADPGPSAVVSQMAGGEFNALRFDVTVTPPAYTGAAVQTLKNPSQIEALVGSRLRIGAGQSDAVPRVRLGQRRLQSTIDAQRVTFEDATITESTYLSLEKVDTTGRITDRALVPIVAVPDRPPVIRIEAPAKDLLLPGRAPDLRVATTATDDHGLTSLELRFTKVSGSGEQFEFEEGALPLAPQREQPRVWKGTAMLPLSRLALQPGDALIYRVVGTDARGAGAGEASSETFFVEIAAPGQVTMAGFELPPDRERYALSQQMIVLKIQRLLARQRSLPKEAVAKEAAGIAAEQRAVRGNFIFLMGGHVEDEEEEAAQSHEIQEGRLENSARREMAAAIGHMSHVEQALAAVDVAASLPPARAAVQALQRAFGRNRYLLRSIPVRSRLDPSRRLSGDLGGTADWKRAAAERETDPLGSTVHRLRAELIGIVSSDRLITGKEEARLESMAEEALRVKSDSAVWRQVAAALQEMRDAAGRGRRDHLTEAAQRAADLLLAEAERAAIGAPRADRDTGLWRAWSQQRRDR